MLVSGYGEEFSLSDLFQQADKVSIGRHSATDISLSSLAGGKEIADSVALLLSRQHAQLAVSEGHLQIRDLGTMNGTYVNNARLKQLKWKVLKDGDVVSFGG